MTKELGKIERVTFGRGGYDDVQFGLSLGFAGEGWGCGAFIGFWDYTTKVGPYTKWTEEDRDKQAADLCRKISNLLKEAKVSEVSQLKDKPVEVTFESQMIKSWRILTEVL